MLLDFDSLDNSAKLFLYPSSKKFYPELYQKIDTELKEFIGLWSDKNDINAGYTIKYQRFVIIAINQDTSIATAVIDELVSFIFKLQTEHNIELVDKLNVCFKQGEHVQYKDVKDFKKMIKSKSVNKNTIVFDHLINTKEELDTDWEIPAEESWYNRMF